MIKHKTMFIGSYGGDNQARTTPPRKLHERAQQVWGEPSMQGWECEALLPSPRPPTDVLFPQHFSNSHPWSYPSYHFPSSSLLPSPRFFLRKNRYRSQNLITIPASRRELYVKTINLSFLSTQFLALCYSSTNKLIHFPSRFFKKRETLRNEDTLS